MANIFCILPLLVIYSSIGSIRTESPPLIFNGDTLEIYPDWNTATKNPGPYAIACPAYLDREQKFDKDGSLDHKALFVRGHAKSKENYSYLLDKKCNEHFKLAAVVRKEEDPKSKDKFVEFGYEVYNEEEKENFNESDFKLFSPLLPPPSFIRKGIDFVKNLGDDKTPYVAEKDEDSPFNYPLKRDLDFIWISRAFMKYDFSNWNVESLTYFITQNKSDLQIECKNKELGMQFYAKDNVNTYYSDVNQKTVFKDVTLPEIRTTYVSPYALLSPYQFQTAPSEVISCSSLVEIPIWYETAEEPLNYSEKFLVAAAQVTNQRLKITVGTYKTLTLKKGNKKHEMFLHGKKMPIPNITYKIVQFKSHDCDTEKSTCWFNAVIVIHNQPKVEQEDIICQDKSEYWGWESLRYMSTTNRDENRKSDFIYVCELNDDMRMKLGYKTDKRYEGNLELDWFPYYNEEETRIEFQDWKKAFETRMRELFETTPEPVVDSNKSQT